MEENSKVKSRVTALTRPDRWLGSNRSPDENAPTGESKTMWNDWKSWKIKQTTLLLFLALTVLLIGGIIALIVVSSVNHGLAPVENASRTVAGVDWRLSLTWTTLPSLLLQIYGLCVAAVVDAFGFRQPFIELARDGGAIARKSIALDYQSFFPGQRDSQSSGGAHAGRANSQKSSKPVIAADSTFYSTTSLNESIDWDLSPVIGAASSTLVYGGSYPRWSNGQHVFLNFSSPNLPGGNISLPKIVATTQAYFAKLECQTVSGVGDRIIRITDPSSPDGNGGTWWLNGTDRGCYWSTNLQISNGFTTYLQTSSKVTCGAYRDSIFSGRMIIVGATNVNFNKTVPTVITCIPTYWNSQARISMNLDQDSRSPILGFELNETKELRPQWWDSFEYELNQVKSIDTTLTGGTSADSAAGFGRVVLDNARLINNANAILEETLTSSSQQVFATVYSLLVNDFMIRPNERSVNIIGNLTFTTNRLFVYNISASIILGLLVCVAILLIMIRRYTEGHDAMLLEEPIGIIGYAGILVDSVVNKIAAAIRGGANYQGKTTEDAMKVLNARDGTAPSFFATYEEDQAATRIALQSRVSEIGFIEKYFPSNVGGPVQRPQDTSQPQPRNVEQVPQREQHIDRPPPQDGNEPEPQNIHHPEPRPLNQRQLDDTNQTEAQHNNQTQAQSAHERQSRGPDEAQHQNLQSELQGADPSSPSATAK
ncbi:uncharacterized protein A1O5_04908 [Cladophialophora psammophila CBS 110553]|uniref:Uncharacterized protein n=1 Tax=Cladophialophora psammophila CBS 110553 TaxID=1182543 RepID=W9XQ05_9EURO|nr:uncharacterized protein A1O5_04908 [Cladophialophora psammophila CBS 110553]EXJ72404.1 hypothetical protein A1O5_04908 [Cladophialophora psammophila CBS 110553]